MPVTVYAAARIRTNSSGVGPDFGTASNPQGTRASRAVGETNSVARGEDKHSSSSCQPAAPINSTPRM